MTKVTKITYKLNEQDIERLERIKVLFSQKTNSKTVSMCIENIYHRLFNK